jgi:murein DD-endopeptidase MepM/ murein hydrolase activator NlpD
MAFVAGISIATTVPSVALTAATPTVRGEAVASVYEPVDHQRQLKSQRVTVGAVELADPGGQPYHVVAAPPPLYSAVASLGTVAIQVSEAIQWPIANHSKVSSGFGGRSAPCGGCSTFHDGIDFTPGAGAAVGSIAGGVVVTATESGGGLGVMVEVAHNIDGELITSLYAHMQRGSLAVSAGDTVVAGQLIGRVGSTGQSTGPHLHLEMFYADGVRFDGYAWLSARLGG